MQLSEAIDRWMEQHHHGLSPSTRRDIGDIATAVNANGFGTLACASIGAPQRLDIIASAKDTSSLNPEAIGQFLVIVVEWGAETGAQLFPSAGPVPVDASVINDLPSDTDDWLDHKAPRVVDDLDLDPWADDLTPVSLDSLPVPIVSDLDDDFFTADEAALVDETADADGDFFAADVGDEADFFAAAPADADDLVPDDEPVEAAQPVEAVADEDLVDEDDLDADELAAIDDDLTFVDEDDLDNDELADLDHDLGSAARRDDLGSAALRDDLGGDEDAVLTSATDDEIDDPWEEDEPDAPETTFESDLDDDVEVVVGSGAQPGDGLAHTASETRAPGDPAASSFLRTLGGTTSNTNVFGDLSSANSADATEMEPDVTDTGVFSEAAQHGPSRSVDWITVAYFSIAAICFALVIYFYLSS